ncbi:hypothetical protein DFJ58DRAFT_856637, partial [Suillus subalutaceus]|uniref:uncharacterized protein n=1 Tax=Suillus subalutaceus TaxID=48586 RepID=UPI001B882CEF
SLRIQLHRVPASIDEPRQKSGFSSWTLVVAGHSYGGCSVMLAALHFPALLSSMILLDATIDNHQEFAWEHTQYLVGITLIRRDQCPSCTTDYDCGEDTLRSFKSSPMFSVWHPDILRLYVDFGLDEDESGCVRLKTPPIHKSLVLANPRAGYETWGLIEKLDEKFYCEFFPENQARTMLVEVRKQRAWRRPANSSNITFKSSSHL